MIIEKHKTIFIHIPKTAGRSIKNSIGAYAEGAGRGHTTLQELAAGIGNDYQEDLPVVCFVRNPYDRLVSAFYYLKIIKIIYFDSPKEKYDQDHHIGLKISLAATTFFSR